jgi:hypothetical protein
MTTEIGVPSKEAVLEAEIVIVFGPLAPGGKAEQIAGILKLGAESGPTIVVLYHLTFQEERHVVLRLAPCNADGVTEGAVHPLDPAFRDYLTVFGKSSMAFDVPEDSEVLGELPEGPAAWCRPIGGTGALYVIPWFLAGASGFVDKLLEAVRNHRSGLAGDVPGYLGELRLGGEADLLARIEKAETQLDELHAEANRLLRFRLLVGPLSGNAFEQLAIKALNEVFDGTHYRAEDRQDLRIEDFWVVVDGEDKALGEAKGLNSHIQREHVNQVDNHRAEQKRQVEELPGLLVVNIFRKDESLEKRLLPVNDDIVRHAVRQNVLILRGMDLYRLLSRKLDGEVVGDSLVEALNSGGGWLEVNDEKGIELHRG